MVKKVLVGESNYAEFEVLNDLLTAKGFKVVWLKNGHDVIDQFPEIRPDLMILDALLPGMTGLKITQAVKSGADAAGVKIILMSSVYKQFREQYETRSKVGVDAYTEKPVNVGELERLITELIGNGQAAEQRAPEEDVGSDAGEPASWTEEEKKTKVGIDGDIAETSFPKLLFYIHKYERTGALRIDRDQISKVVFFQSGFPVLVTSNQSTESLGRFLVQRKLITTVQYNASLERMLQTGKQHGEVLLEMNAITPHDLYRGLYDHIVEKVLSIFSWDHGRYRFKAGRFEVNQNFTINIDPIHLIHSGVRRYYPLSRLESFFNDYKNRRLIRVTDPAVSDQAVGFGPAEMKFITLINDRRTVGQIVSRSNLSLTDTFQILYLFLLIEKIRFKGDPFFGETGLKPQSEIVERRPEKRTFRRTAESDALFEEKLEQFRIDIEDAHSRYENLNYYQLLSIARNADTQLIKSAYFGLSRRFHDHALYNKADEATRRKSDELFQILTQAYTVLISSDTRKKYDYELALQAIEGMPPEEVPLGPESFEAPEPAAPPRESFEELEEAPRLRDTRSVEDEFSSIDESAADGDLTGLDTLWESPAPRDDSAKARAAEDRETEDEEEVDPDEVTSDMADLLKGELAFQEGEDALREEDYPAAAEAFKRALKHAPNEAEYHIYLGRALYLNAPYDSHNAARAVDSIQKGLEINPNMDVGHYFLGVIARDRGDATAAKSSFEKSLSSNPDSALAAEALKELGKV